MRQSLKQLMQRAIVLQYSLPTNVAGILIPRTIFQQQMMTV